MVYGLRNLRAGIVPFDEVSDSRWAMEPLIDSAVDCVVAHIEPDLTDDETEHLKSGLEDVMQGRETLRHGYEISSSVRVVTMVDMDVLNKEAFQLTRLDGTAWTRQGEDEYEAELLISPRSVDVANNAFQNMKDRVTLSKKAQVLLMYAPNNTHVIMRWVEAGQKTSSYLVVMNE